MSTSLHKQIALKQYAESPLGKLEKKIVRFYTDMRQSKKALPEPLAKRIFDIRDTHEKAEMALIEKINREHKEGTENLLAEAFTKELEVINEYLNTNTTEKTA